MTNIAGRLCAHNRATAAGSIIKPTAINVPERLEAGDQIEHDKKQEKKVIKGAATRDGAKEARIEAFRHERPINQGQQ